MASAEEPGTVYILFQDAAGENARQAHSIHTSACSQASKAAAGANRTACPEMPFVPLKTKGRIAVEFASDAADIIESEECACDFQIDLYSLATGQKLSTKTLTFDNMTGFTTAGTVDITYATAGDRHPVSYYSVPNGMYAMLTPGAKYHFYIGDDT
jgi:hypothetical protein